jgi:hypothetical protein
LENNNGLMTAGQERQCTGYPAELNMVCGKTLWGIMFEKRKFGSAHVDAKASPSTFSCISQTPQPFANFDPWLHEYLFHLNKLLQEGNYRFI